MDTEFFYDVVVIGAGHAGCEAAHAAARIGAKVCLVTMDMNKVAQMSCNPAIGGIAKGQIVRETDALGGMTGIVTDATAIQFRMLNRSKGPAMWSPRAQCDRAKFITTWRHHLDHTDNLDIWQDEACEVLAENGIVCGVRTLWGVTIHARAVVVTAGTFLNGPDAIARTIRHYARTHEDWNARENRCTLGALRRYGDATGRERLSPLFLYQRITPPAPTTLLDLQHEC